jgi:hypothetical protein
MSEGSYQPELALFCTSKTGSRKHFAAMATETVKRKFNFDRGARNKQSLQNILELEMDKPGLSGTLWLSKSIFSPTITKWDSLVF